MVKIKMSITCEIKNITGINGHVANVFKAPCISSIKLAKFDKETGNNLPRATKQGETAIKI